MEWEGPAARPSAISLFPLGVLPRRGVEAVAVKKRLTRRRELCAALSISTERILMPPADDGLGTSQYLRPTTFNLEWSMATRKLKTGDYFLGFHVCGTKEIGVQMIIHANKQRHARGKGGAHVCGTNGRVVWCFLLLK